MNSNGIFVISLDCELYWGIRDKRPLPTVQEYLQNTHRIFPQLLSTFRKYEVKATFAVVGLLAADSKEEMRQYIPEDKPEYSDSNLSPYTDNLTLVKESPEDDPYHYGGNLIRLIREYPEHELGTHTFSHYYCQEEGASPESFRADLLAAKAIAYDKGLLIDSLVFPRNQYNTAFMKICEEVGVKTYRGNERVWFRKPTNKGTLPTRMVRTLDCFFNISGNHCYDLKDLANGSPVDIPSSRFLRPYMTKGGALFENLKLRRIKKGMTEAAKKGRVFHLWWHPHNFATNSDQNFNTLEAVLEHFTELKTEYGFENKTMGEAGDLLASVNLNNK
jgi:peptidoglycan/xylan/chitin deacetylase (PgdA/CDA1 family)